MTAWLIVAGVIATILVAIGLIITTSWHKSQKATALIRTGMGAKKVIFDGGVVAFGLFHDLIKIDMTTKKLEVEKLGQHSIITQDNILVDIKVAFFTRVGKTAEMVESAAAALDDKTGDPQALMALLEDKFVGALRSVAANMEFEDLHTDREQFQAEVANNLKDTLAKNGLELEDVSVTSLKATDREYYDATDPQHALGLTKVTQIEEVQKKDREAIEHDNSVARAEKQKEATMQKFNIEQETVEAELNQQREIETKRASQATEIAEFQADQTKKAQVAESNAQREIEETRISNEQQVQTKEVAKNQAIQQAQIESQKAIDISDQDKQIAIENKSKEKSAAEAEASAAEAEAVTASEAVITAQKTAQAERQKTVEIIEAQKVAEVQATSIKVQATAEKEAAADTAEAAKITAKGNADAVTIAAEGEAHAITAKADAKARDYEVEAAGTEALNLAQGKLTGEAMDLEKQRTILQLLPAIIAAYNKPLEKIDSFKLIDMGGANFGNGNTGDGVIDQFFNNIDRQRINAPMINSMLTEAGLDVSNASPASIMETIAKAAQTGTLQNLVNTTQDSSDSASASE